MEQPAKVRNSSAPRAGSALAPVAASMVHEAAARGLAPGPLLERLGLDAASAADPERRVPFAALFAVWAECMRALRDPALPLAAAQRIRLEEYTALGFAATSASSVRAAVSILVRHGGYVADGCGWEVEARPGLQGLRLHWRREGERSLGHRVANECAVAEALHVLRQMVGARVVPLAVAFRHRAPVSAAAHVGFFGVRPRFGAEWEGLELQDALLDRVPRLANPPLAAWLEERLAAALAARRPPDTLAERVEQLLEQDLATGVPDLARVARSLALSERSLRRQLQKERLSFRGLFEAVRRRRAEALLKGGNTTLGEVAFLTGFSELSAFARAFKRWSGQTPGAFRAGAAEVGRSSQ
jgi:AraC-like DNA-binding protein